MHFQTSLTLVFAALAAFEVCAQTDTSNQNILQVLQTNADTTQLYSLLQKYSPSALGFLGANDNSTYTVFAPSNAAFTPQVLALLPTISGINDVFLYHVFNGTHDTASLQDGPNIIDSLANNNTIFKWSNGTGLALNVLKNASAVELHSGFGKAVVTKPDIRARNGVIHLIDSVLGYPQSPSSTIKASSTTDPKLLSQFFGALYRVGLLDTLDNSNGVTIFAPNDQAFSDIDMVSMTNDTLGSLLKYHVLNNVYYTTNLTNATHPITLTTLNNTALNLTQSGDTIAISNGTDDAKVVLANILTNNGVIHVIDKVLFPPNSTYSNILAGGNANATGNTTTTAPSGQPNGAPSSTQISRGAALLSIVAVVSTLFF